MIRDEHDPPSDSDVVVVREVVGAAQSREELDALVERLTTSGFDRSDVNLTASASTSRRNRRRDTLEAVGPNGRLGPVKICEYRDKPALSPN